VRPSFGRPSQYTILILVVNRYGFLSCPPRCGSSPYGSSWISRVLALPCDNRTVIHRPRRANTSTNTFTTRRPYGVS